MDIKHHMLLSKEERRSHLRLDEPCSEIGGYSTQFKALLAYYLNTTIPKREAILCHACNNESCSNPKHLYWGTYLENYNDGVLVGTQSSIWERCVQKYGLEEAKRRNTKGDKAAGGKANKGRPKSEEHKRKIAEGLKRRRM